MDQFSRQGLALACYVFDMCCDLLDIFFAQTKCIEKHICKFTARQARYLQANCKVWWCKGSARFGGEHVVNECERNGGVVACVEKALLLDLRYHAITG